MEQHQKQPKQVLIVYNNNNNSIYIGVQGGGRGWLPPPRLLCRLGQSGNIRFTVGQYYYKNKMEKFSQYIG